MATFIAMNRFEVNPERGAEFEEHWRKRETYLHEVPGFRRFALLRGDEPGQYIEYLKQILDTQRVMNSQLIDYNQNLTQRLLDTAAAASER